MARPLPQPPSPPPDRGLGFTFRLAAGSGKLTLADRQLFDSLYLERLELEVPELRLPIDLAAGPEMFQRKRTRVHLASLRVAPRDLERFVARSAPVLSAQGIDEVALRGADGYLGVTARVREGVHVAELTARLYLRSDGPSLRVAADHARIYGFLPSPAPLVVHRILAALAAGLDGGRSEVSPVRGLGQIAVEPLDAILWQLMPRAGWRMPDRRGVRIAAVQVSRSAVSLRLADGGSEGDGPIACAPEALDLALELDKLRPADDLLAAGDLEGAMRAYRALLAARGPEQPFLVSRALAVASARRELFVDGTELARQALGRWPDFAPAHAAIAAIAVAQGEVEAAAARYRTLAEVCAASGDDEATARAAVTGARLLRHVSPADSTALYERVLEHRPSNTEAAEALAERYTDEQRWHDMARLIRGRLASTTDPTRQARDHVRLSRVLSRQLDDLEGARIELERACELDRSDPEAFEALAEVQAELGEVTGAVATLDIAVRLYAERRDPRGEARIHLRAAEQLAELGDDERAAKRYQHALDLVPNLPEALSGAARAAARQGRHADAAELWQRLIDEGSESPAAQASYSCELGRNLLASGDIPGARAALDHASTTGDPDIASHAHAMLADIALAGGDKVAAVAQLAAAISVLVDDPDAAPPGQGSGEVTVPRTRAQAEERTRITDLSLRRAILLEELGRAEDALGDHMRAFELSDNDWPARARAARALLADARRRRDTAAERRWLDALLALPLEDAERAAALLARARLAVDAGRSDPRAVEDVDAALRLAQTDGQRTEALIVKSELLIAAGDAVGRARALAERARLATAPAERAAATIEAAEAWLAADNTEEALAAASSALSLYSADPALRVRTLTTLGEAAWRRRAWEDVARAYTRILSETHPELARTRPILFHRLAIARDRMGDAAGARTAFEEVASDPAAPGDLRASSWRNLAQLHERVGQLALAARAFEAFASDARVEAGSAARADAWYRAGELYRRHEGSNENSQRCLEAALHIAGDHLPALDALERIKREEQEWDRVAVILGRKIAATSRHPNRQKSLLARLAALQDETLGRTDVARMTYARALEIDPDFRPALRFVARDLLGEGQLASAAEAYERLARDLPSDVDLPDAADALAAERTDAAVALTGLWVDRGGDQVIAVDRVIAALEANLQLARDDGRLLNAAERVHRTRRDWLALSEVLAHKASIADQPEAALAIDLERIEVLRSRLEDPGAALAATRAALARNADSEVLRRTCEELESALATSEATEPSTDDPREVDGLIESARARLEAGDIADAAQMLQTVATDSAPEALLALRIEVAEAGEDWGRAAADLGQLRERALRARDVASELRVARRLAAITAEHLRDAERAAALYERAVVLDPDDLASAEALAELAGKPAVERPDADAKERSRRHIRALLRVLEVARRTRAGAAVESAALAELSRSARRTGDVAGAVRYLDEAIQVAPSDVQLLRERAELAQDTGDYARAAAYIESLLERFGSELGRHLRGELQLQLADLYYDHLDDVTKAREAMRHAADAFGSGARREAALRLLANEAMSAGDHDQAALAFEGIGAERLAPADRIAMAKEYQRLGREQSAIDMLEHGRAEGNLAEEGTLLLFALYRQRKRKQELAESLERGANQSAPPIAATRLIEALQLYESALADNIAAQRVRDRLTQLAQLRRGPGDASPIELPRSPRPEELERAAEAAAIGDDVAVAADLFARAIVERTARGRDLDDRGRQVLDGLRDAARRSEHYDALVHGLTAAASVAAEQRDASGFLREAAALRRVHLHDVRGAADMLSQALALTPEDSSLMDEIDATLREAGDYSQLVSMYELHLSSLSGRLRASALVELARIYRDVFQESGRAAAYLRDALAEAPEVAAQIGDELEELERPEREIPTEYFPETTDVEAELARAEELESIGEREQAVAHYEAASAAVPDDLRALEALERLYASLGDMDALSEVLGRMTVVVEDPAQRAKLWFRRARLYRDLLREPEAYRCLKEAFANAPEDAEIVYGLRTVAMARGEWALAAELLYREIEASFTTVETAALYLELALIYDEKLGDPEQAEKNYEQSLDLDPEIPAAPRPLARLYELGGRHREAATMYELAAAHAAEDPARAKLLRHAAINAERVGDVNGARRLYSLAAATADSDDGRAAQAAIARLTSAPADAAARLRTLEGQLANASHATVRSELLREALEMASAAGDTRAVERHARALLDANSTDVSGYIALKSRASAERDWDTLASLLAARADAIVDRHERAGLYFELGRAYESDLNDVNAAIGAYESALAAEPEHPGALEALAELAYRRRDWLQARGLYERLRPDHCSMPADVIAFRRGEIAEALGEEQDAVEAFAEAVRLFPSSREALSALTRAALRVGDLARARGATEALLELLSSDDVDALTSARLQLADLCRRAGDHEAALQHFELTLKEEPNSVPALTNLVDLYTRSGDAIGAARVLRSLIGLSPGPGQRADLLYQLAEIYRSGIGDNDLAADAYLKAIDLDPGHRRTLRRLIDYYWRIGDLTTLHEIAHELHSQGGLAQSDTPLETIARAMLIEALIGLPDVAIQLGEKLGQRGPELLADMLVEALERELASENDLSSACARMIAGAGINSARTQARLAALTSQSAAARTLLAAMSGG